MINKILFQFKLCMLRFKKLRNFKNIWYLYFLLFFFGVLVSCQYPKHLFDSLILFNTPKNWPIFKVVIDPGHGGAAIVSKEDGKVIKSDRWDPKAKTYLSYYATGMETQTLKERHVVLDLSKKVFHYLELTKTEKGWEQFETLLRKFSSQNSFNRVVIDSVLTRNESWEDRFDKIENLYVNNEYRMLDYPDDRGRLRMGRMSFINYHHPSLLLSLHTTPAGSLNEGGMAAVLSPGYKSYKEVIDLKKRSRDFKSGLATWKRMRSGIAWNGKVLKSERSWNQFQLMHADAWTYFHGYRSNEAGNGPDFEKPRGLRQNMIHWIYKDNDYFTKEIDPYKPGPYSLVYKNFKPEGAFWDRERSNEELWRREDGIKGFGGDNHYASDEIMRYIQHGVRLLKPYMRMNDKIGPIQVPFASSYLLPIYVNCIVSFIEIAFLNIQRDRDLILKEQEAVAQSIAVAVYSLYSGLKLKPLPPMHLQNKKLGDNPFLPKALPLNFEKYKNYFDKVTN